MCWAACLYPSTPCLQWHSGESSSDSVLPHSRTAVSHLVLSCASGQTRNAQVAYRWPRVSRNHAASAKGGFSRFLCPSSKLHVARSHFSGCEYRINHQVPLNLRTHDGIFYFMSCLRLRVPFLSLCKTFRFHSFEAKASLYAHAGAKSIYVWFLPELKHHLKSMSFL